MLSRFGTPQLLVSAAVLVGGGLVMLYSASAVRSEQVFGVSYEYVVRQLGGAGVGLVALLALSRFPVPWLQRLAYLAWLGALGLIAATFSPLGHQVNGAQRWLVLGPVLFQPLEPAKLAVVLAVARWLATHQDRMNDIRVSIAMPALLTGAPALLLLAQPDFGGAALMLLNTSLMVFAAGARVGHMALVGLAAVPVAAVVALGSAYRLRRLQMFLNPWADPLGHGYQLVQSQLAFGVGGVSGVGLGAGQQKLFYLPEAHTDFILSVIGEEAGLIGVAALLGCFAVLALSTLGIASRASSAFATLLALGAGLVLWLQAALNAGVALGLLPTKGTTLPLISYGGSSIASSLAAIGLILAVARPRRSGRSGWR
jgi:cell division protein FtsW